MLLSGNGLETDSPDYLGLPIAALANTPMMGPVAPPVEQRSGDGSLAVIDMGPMPLPRVSGDSSDDGCLLPLPDELTLLAELGRDAAGALGANPFETFTYETEPDGLPILHGYIEAPAAIYIDFDGDDTHDTTYSPYDEDGDPTTFNAAEQASIVECWRQVSMYFAMFNVDVTTNKAVVTEGHPLQKPTAWMVMSPDIANGWSGLGVFPNSRSESYARASYTRTRATVVPHEIGHNFGLWHTSEYNNLGVKTLEYAREFDPLHGAMMGVDFYGIICKWSIWHGGTARGVNNPTVIQDDMAVIANKLQQVGGGDGYRPDDFAGVAGSIADATPLYVDGVTQAIVGIIERLTDVDTFSFVSEGERYAIAAMRDAPSGVDLRLTIFDANSEIIASEDGDPRAEPYTMVNDQFITMDLAPGTYYATVESHGNYCDLGQYFLRVDPVPAGWSAEDIGLTGVPGYSSYESATGTFTVAGSGSNISGAVDSYHYLYQTLHGDGSITVRVASLINTSTSAKAGVMIRESLDVDSRFVNLYLRPGSGVYSDYRGSTGGGALSNGSNASSSIKAPYWLQLTRTGNTFTTKYSSNGTSWSTLSTRTVMMGETVYIGVATCSVSNFKLNTATYTNMSLAGNVNPEPTLNGLSAPSGMTITGKTSNSMNLSWNAVSGATGYRIEQSNDEVNYAQVGTTAAGVTSYSPTGLADYNRYFFRVRAVDASGVSAPSDVVHDVTRAGAVSNLNIISFTQSILVLNWKDAAGETRYRIERSRTGTGSWSTVATVDANVPIFANRALSFGSTYYYRVVTLDAEGDSAVSEVIVGCTRLYAPTGLRATSVSHEGISLQWNSVASATSYRVERSTDGGETYATHAVGVTDTFYTDTSVAASQEYCYRVVAMNSLTESITPSLSVKVSLLHEPWATQDIGAVGVAGSVQYGNGTFTVAASGADISGVADEFRFVYQQLPGDGQIIARVASLQNTHAWAKAGVMIRESLDANSRYAFTMVTPGNGTAFESRATTGGSAVTNATRPSVTAPYWVRISREGDTLTSAVSANGTSWTTLGSTNINMGSTVYVGLALTSHDDSTLCTGTFTDVSLLAAPVVVVPASATWNPGSGATLSLSVLGTDNGGEASLTYTWVATSVPPSASQPTYSDNGTNDAKNTTATLYAPGDYGFRVTIRDGDGLTATSDVLITVHPSLNAIIVSPSSPILPFGGTQSFTAIGYDQFGNLVDPPPTFDWTAASGQITADGLYTAPSSPTTDTVTATSGEIQGTAEVAVVPTPLPAPWQSRDVGIVDAAGGASWWDGAFTVEGSGANIAGFTDEFHYVYQALTGNGRITARVVSIEQTDPFAKAGVMMRQSFHGNSPNVALLVTPGQGIRLQYRLVAGNTTGTIQAGSPSLEAPYWVRMTRLGDTYTSEISPDGTTWTAIGSVSVAMGETIYVGLPVTSRVPGELCTAVFTDVRVDSFNMQLPGDADYSGTVDANDAAILAANWGKTGMSWQDGDFNNDGVVNALDAAILAANYGATRMAGETAPTEASVPVGPFSSDGHFFVGPLAVGDPPSTRQLIEPVRRVSKQGTDAMRSLEELLIGTTPDALLAASDAALAEEYDPPFRLANLPSRQLAWQYTLARRQSHHQAVEGPDRSDSPIDLLLANRWV